MKLFELECPNCGGNLILKSFNHAVCENCSSRFIIEQTNESPKVVPQNRTPQNVSSRVSVVIVLCITVILVLSVAASLRSPSASSKTVKTAATKTAKASSGMPVSEMFQAFAMKALDRNIQEITPDDLASIKYMSISFTNDMYVFSYSFSDFDSPGFDSTILTASFKRDTKYSSSDIGCFTGLTKFETKTLSIKNADCKRLTSLRSLTVRSGLSDIVKTFPTEQITELRLEYPSFTDLTGIDKFTSLQKLTLYHGDISDISLLSSCTGLTSLEIISCDEIEDFSVLYLMKNLRTLNLDDLELKEIGFISQMPALYRFELSETQVLDLSALNNNTVIKELTLSENSKVIDYSAINTMTQLEALKFERYFSQKFPVLDNLSNVTKLYLSRVEDIGILYNFQNCTELTLDCCSIKNAEPLASMQNLTSLTLKGIYSNFSDVKFLTGLTKLRYLDISGSNIYNDATELFMIPELETLDISSCELRFDESRIPTQTKLRRLYLKNITLYRNLSISSDGFFTNISYDKEMLQDRIGFLSHFPNLTHLDISSNKIQNIDFVESLPALEVLDISDNYVTDLRPLEKLGSLKEIYISKNSIVQKAALRDNIIIHN